MLPDDHILCCLLPNLCNLFNQSVSVSIFIAIVFGVNWIIGIYILGATIRKLWIIWKHHMKKILTNMVKDSKCRVKITPFRVTDKCCKTKNIMDDKGDTAQYNNCNTIDKIEVVSCKNISNAKTESETENCIKHNDKERKKHISNLKKNPENVATECLNKKKSLKLHTQKINKDNLFITTYAKKNSKMYTNKCIIPDSCWSRAKKICRGCT